MKMSCVLPDGKAFEQEITGYLVGEDGKQGIPGKLVDKEGRKIAFAAVAGVGAGLARAFGQQQVTNVVTIRGRYFNRHRRRSYLRTGERRPGCRDRDAALLSEAGGKAFSGRRDRAGKNVTMVMLSGTKVPGLEAMNRTDPRRGLD